MIVEQNTVSGLLTHPTGPSGEITTVPAPWFSAHGAHSATSEAWAAVMHLGGRTELPLSAVVSFQPDPGVRDRWERVFSPS